MNDENNPIVQTVVTPKPKGFFRELVEVVIFVLVILLPVRYFVAQPFVVVGTSMYPTFQNGDYLIVDEISYRFKNPERGDVIVFVPPTNPKEHYIKRIIGLPGEKISVWNNTITIKNNEHPEGVILNEPYIHSERDFTGEITLESDEYFVMGDNRSVSSDSRVWGPLKRDKISGRALFRLYPISSIDFMPGKEKE